MRLIDADALESVMDDKYTLGDCGRRERDDVVDALRYNAPTVDAVLVVRCKDCKNARAKENGYYACEWSAFLTGADWYCSHGERKGGGE